MIEMLIGAGVATLIATAIVGPVRAAGDAPALLLAIPPLVAVAGVAAAMTLPGLRYRVHRWEVTDLGLYTRRGWPTRVWTIVPHARIQTVDTSSGPLERRFGLATVQVRTASGEAVGVPGLSRELVAELTDELAARAGVGDAT
jgi:membrane protein YdbS with pleckstrin-like domain